MKFPAAKLIATIACSLSMLGAAAPTEACCFLSSLFGCCSPRYGACYAPSGCSPCGPSGCSTSYYSPGCSTGSCGSTAYYSPRWSSSCNTCAPCGTGCSPCGSSCAGGACASGDCAVSSAAGSTSVAPPVADPTWRKKTPETYAPQNGGTGSSSGSSSGNDASGAGSSGPSGGTRTKPEGFRNDEEDSTSNFKPPMGTDIQQTGGEESGDSVPVRPRGTKSPEAPSIPADDEAGSGAGHLPTLNLDEKVAWRSPPERKRIALKVRTANARLVRVPAYPKSDWTPVEPESKVAKK